MAFYVQFSSGGRPLSPGKSMIHGMECGLIAVTPRNLNQGVFQMAGASAELTGQSTGKREHKPISITKEKDFSSPMLFSALCNQENIAALDINIIEASSLGSGGKEKLIGKIALTDAAIAKYTWKPKPHRHGSSSSQAHTNELEEFDLTFSKITYSNVFASKSSKDDWTTGS
jgi:type VI secretion system secreted protein Hcp